MGEYIKSYQIFLPNKFFNLILFLVYTILAGGMLLINYWIKNNIMTLVLAGIIIIALESIFDFYTFGGFAKRDSDKFEYLKSSEKYIIFVKRALIIDMFRRFINTVIIELIFGIIADLSIISILFSVGITYFFEIVTISVERFFDTFTFIYIITCFFILLYCVTYYILTNCRFMLISGLAMLLVCILILVKEINFLIKRTKEAYYDR